MNAPQIILLATARPQTLEKFGRTLAAQDKFLLIQTATAEETLTTAARTVPAFAVIDRELNGVEAIEIVRRLLHINAFINTAVLSDMDEDTFHEYSEGLGILAALPMMPGEKEANDLAERFRLVAAGAGI